ncbi:MAG TPA: hypothetical protein VLF39_03865 [Candidatus Saccharimonadales bacterium]|nr:hypothetical protein [Candidatus Saccharimonadales bacterium]
MDQPSSNSSTKSKKFNFQSLILPILIASLVLAGYLVKEITSVKSLANDLDSRVTKLEQPNKYFAAQIDKNEFQAVFLNNNQVYFGKITHVDASTLTLEDIYYLKSGNINPDGTIAGQIALTKLGKELHSPEDKMVIERKNITLWENMKSDGQVAKAIADYEKSHKK